MIKINLHSNVEPIVKAEPYSYENAYNLDEDSKQTQVFYVSLEGGAMTFSFAVRNPANSEPVIQVWATDPGEDRPRMVYMGALEGFAHMLVYKARGRNHVAEGG